MLLNGARLVGSVVLCIVTFFPSLGHLASLVIFSLVGVSARALPP